MQDLFDMMVTSRERSARDVWSETTPDFDAIFEWESDDPTPDDEECSLDEWLDGR
jgi:hypothetical protein